MYLKSRIHSDAKQAQYSDSNSEISFIHPWAFSFCLGTPVVTVPINSNNNNGITENQEVDRRYEWLMLYVIL